MATLHLCDRCNEKAHMRIVIRRIPISASEWAVSRAVSITAIGRPEITMDLCQGCYHALKVFLMGEEE